MKKPFPDGSMEGPNGLKAFAKQLVNQYFLGVDAVRFSVVSFAADATTRVPWSYNAAEINAGIDAMRAGGGTSISDGFDAARQLFGDGGRLGATKIALLLSDGQDSGAVAAAALVKGDGVTVFAWGFGSVSSSTLRSIATDPSKAFLASDLAALTNHLAVLQAAVCGVSPPPPPPPSWGTGVRRSLHNKAPLLSPSLPTWVKVKAPPDRDVLRGGNVHRLAGEVQTAQLQPRPSGLRR